mgnify:FL=1|tara:strand:+ start:798 stop:2525 length:1728 start_codon:yes stop_codon:yes gene_type:complete
MARKDYPDISPENYNPDAGDAMEVKKLEKKFEESKKAKQHKVPRWRRNEELYNGNFLKPFNLPKYKSRIVANTVHSTIETMYSIVTDREPKVDVMPRREEQVDKARTAQETIEAIFEKSKVQRAVAMMKRDGLIYGNGFIKMVYDDSKGEIKYLNPDPYTVFFDPLCTNMSNAKCVVFATPTYLSEIRDKYTKGKYVKDEGRLTEYKSFVKLSKQEKEDKDNFNVRTEGPLEESDTSSQDYAGGQALLKEAWYYEGDTLYLATWAGNVLLQKEQSPYNFIPLVTFKNYQNAHTIWGKGEPEPIESLCVGTAILLSQGIDNIIYHGNPAMVMSKAMAKTVGNRPSDKPGQIYYTNGPHEQVNRLPAGNISSSTLPMAQTLMQMTDTVSGVHDITQGRNPSGVTASRAIQQLQEASQQVIRAKEREIGTDSIIDLYKYTLRMLAMNFSREIDVRTFSQSGAGYEFKKVNPIDLDPDMDFKYVPGSSMPESRASRMDQAMDLLQMGLLDPEKFWRWVQKDISKDILNEILEQKEQMQQQYQQDIETMQTSEDPQEITDAQLRIRQMMGMQDEQAEAPQ